LATRPQPVRAVADDSSLVASILDPDGRPVDLTEDRWRHIVAGHPDLRPYLRSILDAVRHPDRRVPGRGADEEWFYLADAGPSRWLKVVVHFESGRGRIVTAFARRSMP
jgi:hypothetical protein